MKNISFVGGKGSGKTTALGLLCKALTQYAGAHTKSFEFEPDHASLKYLNDKILTPLLKGEWPEKTEPGIREEVKLLFRRKGWLGRDQVEFTSYDLSGEELERDIYPKLREATTDQVQQVVRDNEVLKHLMDAEVFVFVVDATSCNPNPTAEEHEKKIRNDFFLQQLWMDTRRYRRAMRLKTRGLAFLFAKYDDAESYLNCGQMDFYSINDIHKAIRTCGRTVEEYRGLSDICRLYLPQAYASIGYEIDKIADKKLRYFKSGITVRKGTPDGKPPKPTVPLEFSIAEYINLANWLLDV